MQRIWCADVRIRARTHSRELRAKPYHLSTESFCSALSHAVNQEIHGKYRFLQRIDSSDLEIFDVTYEGAHYKDTLGIAALLHHVVDLLSGNTRSMQVQVDSVKRSCILQNHLFGLLQLRT